MSKVLRRLTLLWLFGGAVYILMELAARSHTHWTMFIVGGFCFVSIGLINELFTEEMPMEQQCAIGAVCVTMVEFVAGCIINLGLGWNVWDYSNLPFNVLGQICLPFTILWFFVSMIAIYVDDWLRWKWFDEPQVGHDWLIVDYIRNLFNN